MISIITPAYNQSLYIADCIDSVLSQSYQHFEFIIINDGSTDSTEEIILSFKDDRIVYICQENQGVSGARNAGLMRMRGDFFCFIDADDLLPEISLASRLAILDRDPDLDFADGCVNYYDNELKRLLKTWKPDFKGQPLEDLLNLSARCFFGNTWMVRRTSVNIPQFDIRLTHGEDLLFYIELARQGGGYSYSDEAVLHYRQGKGTAMKQLANLEAGYRHICNVINKFPDIPEEWVRIFTRKSHRIMLRSYLGNQNIQAAAKMIFSKWP